MNQKVLFLFFAILSAIFLTPLPAGDFEPVIYSQYRDGLSRFVLAETDADKNPLKISYYDSGNGSESVILMVHGVPTSSWLYRRIIPALEHSGFRVIAPDNLGFGGSSKPDGDHHYALAKQAERLNALMDSLEIVRWTQVLHDVGGPITWEMMYQSPGKIERLVILNTFAYEAGWNASGLLDLPLVQALMKRMGFDRRPVIRSTVCGMVSDRSTLDNPESLEGYYWPMDDGADAPYLAFLKSFSEVRQRLPLYEMVIKNADIPAVIIWGGKDKILRADQAVPLFMRDLGLSDRDVHILPDAEHLITEEAPDAVSELMMQFLNS